MMFVGELIGIFVGSQPGEEPVSVSEATALAGQGLAGDRYCFQPGRSQKPHKAEREVTLIEFEAIEAAARENNVELTPAQARRNLLTRGVPLNHLVGREFQIGRVKLRGELLCEPCKHLETMTRYGVVKAFLHRGGLRAAVVVGGVLQVGDEIRVAE